MFQHMIAVVLVFICLVHFPRVYSSAIYDTEMLESLFGAWSRNGNYCSSDFRRVWSGFVDAFTDSIVACGEAAPPPPRQVQQEPTHLPAVDRIVAIGDLHGDFQKARRAFRIGGLIDEDDRWAGGTTTAVQVGDQLDRGDNELQLLYWLERLQREAAAAGGALHVLNGNHETMNIGGNFRYATQQAAGEFRRWHMAQHIGQNLKAKCGCDKGSSSTDAFNPNSDNPLYARAKALRPGGDVTQRFLARHPIILQIGSTVFVHGGVLPWHATYGLERINRETQEWMTGKRTPEPEFLRGRDAVVWAREYSERDADRCDCETLQRALGMIPGAQRMVVGHTIQTAGINSACSGQVIRVDVGLSKGCGDGQPQVLEILRDKEVKLLSERKQPDAQVTEPPKDTSVFRWPQIPVGAL